MIVFRNPGLIDIRAVNTQGLSAKPASASPIGYFGTGLKYAIAIILRLGGRITIYRGRKPHVFTLKTIKFRGEPVPLVHMNGMPLSYTSALGKHWDAWQAYREIHANTLDENGTIYFTDRDPGGEPNSTTIVVDGADFDAIYESRKTIFLEGVPAHKEGGVEIHLGESGVIYYKGMRAMTLKTRSAWTWNITAPMELTEDRTIKYTFAVEALVERAILECTSPAIVSAMLTADPNSWEGKLNYDVPYAQIGSTFMNTAANLKAAKANIVPGAWKLFQQKAHQDVMYIGAISRGMAPVEAGQFKMAAQMISDRLPGIDIGGLTVHIHGNDEARMYKDRVTVPQDFFDQSIPKIAAALLAAYANNRSPGRGDGWLAQTIISGFVDGEEPSNPQTPEIEGAALLF